MKVYLKKVKWNGALWWSPALFVELENGRVEVWDRDRSKREHPLVATSRSGWDQLVEKGYAKYEVHSGT